MSATYWAYVLDVLFALGLCVVMAAIVIGLGFLYQAFSWGKWVVLAAIASALVFAIFVFPALIS